MARRFSPQIEAAIEEASKRTGMPVEMLRGFVAIESGGNPNLVNKYGYTGLLQFQPREYQRLGGTNIADPVEHLTIGAKKLQGEMADFRSRYGRDPTGAEIYMMHQQGVGGSAQHWANPDRPAWQNMLATGEGRQKGEDWAKRAIWDNLPPSERARYGSVENVKSADFTNFWANRYAQLSGTAPAAGPAPVMVADATKPPVASPPAAVPAPGVAETPPIKPPASAQPTALASLFGLNIPGTGFAGQPLAPAAPAATAPAATPTASLTEAITTGNLNLGPFSLGGVGGGQTKAADSAAAEEVSAPAPVQLDLGGKPIDMQRLLAVLNNRSKLGLA